MIHRIYFDLLDIEYEKMQKPISAFAKIRKLAEADLRQKITGDDRGYYN